MNHQKEMQDILADAASKIKRFKEQLESKRADLNAHAQVQKIQEKLDKEKALALEEFRRFKEKAASREEELRQECNTRVADLSADVDREKGKMREATVRFADLTARMKKAFEESRTAGDGQLRYVVAAPCYINWNRGS